MAIKRLSGLALPQGENPVADVIPVARIADMLLNPGQPYDFNGEQRKYPDIRLIYWAGGNPFHHHQDLNRLEDAWSRPETIIVNEPWWTPTAKRADIVFPATTPYEREDIGRSNIDPFLFNMPRLIEPQGQSRDDYSIFAALAERLDAGEVFTEGRDAEAWQRHLYGEFRQAALSEGVETPDFDELREKNWVELPIAGPATCADTVRGVQIGSRLGTAGNAVRPDRDLLGTYSGLRLCGLSRTPGLVSARRMAGGGDT